MSGLTLTLLVWLAGGIYLPAPPTSAAVTVVTEAPDWASNADSDYPATDMLGGDADLTGWVQANTLGAGHAIDTVAVDTGRGSIKLVHTSGGAEDAGYLTDAVAGDFCYAIRWAHETDQLNATSVSFQNYAVFVDSGGDNLDADDWYGLGAYRVGTVYATNNWQWGRGNTGGDMWANNAGATLLRNFEASSMDLLFKRSGTTLSLFFALPGSGAWVKGVDFTVTALAGKIGIRLRPAAAYTITTHILAFKRWTFADCPR